MSNTFGALYDVVTLLSRPVTPPTVTRHFRLAPTPGTEVHSMVVCGVSTLHAALYHSPSPALSPYSAVTMWWVFWVVVANWLAPGPKLVPTTRTASPPAVVSWGAVMEVTVALAYDVVYSEPDQADAWPPTVSCHCSSAPAPGTVLQVMTVWGVVTTQLAAAYCSSRP